MWNAPLCNFLCQALAYLPIARTETGPELLGELRVAWCLPRQPPGIESGSVDYRRPYARLLPTGPQRAAPNLTTLVRLVDHRRIFEIVIQIADEWSRQTK